MANQFCLGICESICESKSVSSVVSLILRFYKEVYRHLPVLRNTFLFGPIQASIAQFRDFRGFLEGVEHQAYNYGGSTANEFYNLHVLSTVATPHINFSLIQQNISSEVDLLFRKYGLITLVI